MIEEKIRRNYNLSDSKLDAIAFNLCHTLSTDIDDLAIYGVTEAKVEEFKNLYREFASYEILVMSYARINHKTEVKRALFSDLKDSIKKMALRFQLKWGKKSAQYKKLGLNGMQNLIDDSTIALARRVLEQMRLNFEELTEDGLTENMVIDFENLIIDAEAAKNEQNNALTEKEVKTYERIKKGNELYSLVVKYCEIGKRVYAKKSHPKYKNYLIY